MRLQLLPYEVHELPRRPSLILIYAVRAICMLGALVFLTWLAQFFSPQDILPMDPM